MKPAFLADPGPWREEIRRQFPAVLRQEGARWGFVLRAALAAFIALGLAMFLELDQPSTAMVTALVVIQPQSGAVISKSFYRVLGTLAGGVVAVLLFSLFAQQQPLLIAGMCLWVAVCTAGSAQLRHYRAYGFVLAGYTACLIALPNLNTPELIFTAASLRISEVFIGILSVALSSEIIFPKAIQNTLYAMADNCFISFGDLACTTLTGEIPIAEMERIQLRFIRDVATLDGHGASAAFEAGGALDHSRVRLFNTEFMVVSTSFHAMSAFINALPKADDDPVRIFFRNILAEVAKCLAPQGVFARTPEEAGTAASSLAACREKVDADLAALFAHSRFYLEERRFFESGMHILHRFLTDMQAYLLQYAHLRDPRPSAGSRSFRSNAGTDRGIALVAGLRAGLVLALVALFWHAADWSVGSQAAIFAVVFCSLQAASSNPTRSIMLSISGCILGVALGMVYCFQVLPHMPDFVPMCAALFPFLAVGTYLMTIPSVGGLGGGYNFVFASFANPGLALHIVPESLVAGGLGQLSGILLAGVMLAVFLPSGGAWWKRRLQRGLLREAARTCRGRPGSLLPHFESRTRNILLQHITSALPTDKEKQTMLKRALAIGNLGRVTIEIRHNISEGTFSPAEKKLLLPIMAELQQVLEIPSFSHYRVLLAKIQDTARKLEDMTVAGVPTCAPGGAASLTRILQRALMHMAEELRMFKPRRSDAGRRQAHAA